LIEKKRVIEKKHTSPVSKRRVTHRKEGLLIIDKKHIRPVAKHRKEAHLIRNARCDPGVQCC